MSMALGAQAGRLSSRLLHDIKHTDSHFSHIPIYWKAGWEPGNKTACTCNSP